MRIYRLDDYLELRMAQLPIVDPETRTQYQRNMDNKRAEAWRRRQQIPKRVKHG